VRSFEELEDLAIGRAVEVLSWGGGGGSRVEEEEGDATIRIVEVGCCCFESAGGGDSGALVRVRSEVGFRT